MGTEQEPPLVLADFNAMLTTRALNLEVTGTRWDLDRLKVKIKEGLRLRAFDFDTDDNGPNNLIAEGVVERWTAKSGNDHWVLVLDYFGYESDIRHDTKHWANHVDWDEEREVRERWRREHRIDTTR